MSEQNHNRMREWMDRESKVDDQYARDTYFLVNWKELAFCNSGTIKHRSHTPSGFVVRGSLLNQQMFRIRR